jgi:hypothetical protein
VPAVETRSRYSTNESVHHQRGLRSPALPLCVPIDSLDLWLAYAMIACAQECSMLIAEGNADLCKIYRPFFSPRGFRVEIASDGLDCLEKLRRRTFAVVVLDWQLRWGGGEGLLAWLREQSAAAGAPVVLTAMAANLWMPTTSSRL